MLHKYKVFILGLGLYLSCIVPMDSQAASREGDPFLTAMARGSGGVAGTAPNPAMVHALGITKDTILFSLPVVQYLDLKDRGRLAVTCKKTPPADVYLMDKVHMPARNFIKASARSPKLSSLVLTLILQIYTDVSAEDLIKAVAPAAGRLESLVLHYNSSGGFFPGGHLFALDLPKIKHLHLKKVDLRGTNLESLLQAIRTGKLKHLKELGLQEVGIGTVGAQALAASFKNLPELESLHLIENGIDNEGAQALAASLENLPSLKFLQLMRNTINDAGARVIADAIARIHDANPDRKIKVNTKPLP